MNFFWAGWYMVEIPVGSDTNHANFLSRFELCVLTVWLVGGLCIVREELLIIGVNKVNKNYPEGVPSEP